MSCNAQRQTDSEGNKTRVPGDQTHWGKANSIRATRLLGMAPLPSKDKLKIGGDSIGDEKYHLNGKNESPKLLQTLNISSTNKFKR